MPELPEVEVIRRDLQSLCKDRPHLEKFDFLRRDLRGPIPVAQILKLEGAQILGIHRRAKYLIFETDRGGLLSHLGMTGTWRVVPQGQERVHDHIYLHLSSGIRLGFRDPRRFGIFECVDFNDQQNNPRLSKLGPEPLGADFDAVDFWQALRQRTTAVKVAIMDQKLVVGVGNIYASEALFLAGIRPGTKSFRVSLDRATKLVEAIRQVLSSAIEAGGSSISDFLQFSGEAGGYQNNHQVYGHGGQLCRKCGHEIRSQVMGGRSTFWCPVCQK